MIDLDYSNIRGITPHKSSLRRHGPVPMLVKIHPCLFYVLLLVVVNKNVEGYTKLI